MWLPEKLDWKGLRFGNTLCEDKWKCTNMKNIVVY
jgi:hypothetical protein